MAATHWLRRHAQLTDILPSPDHTHHLTPAQYETLTQGHEATGLHYHVQRPATIPLLVAADGATVRALTGVRRAYAVGFPRRGFGASVNPYAPIALAPGTEATLTYGAQPEGWVSVWARESALLFAPVFRVGQWVDQRTFTLGAHTDPGTPVSLTAQGVDLTPFRDTRPFLFLFGQDLLFHARLADVTDDGTQATVTLDRDLPSVPTTRGHWVYVSEISGTADPELRSSYAGSFYHQGGVYYPARARTLGDGVFDFVAPFYYGTVDDWVDADLSTVVPPTTVAVDLVLVSTSYNVAAGVYHTLGDAASLERALAQYGSWTRLPDGYLRACGAIPKAVVRYDEDNTPHLYLWVTRYATVAVSTVYEL